MQKVTDNLLGLGVALAMAISATTTTMVVGSAASPVSAAEAAWTLPTVPPKCTTTQVTSGNVAGCVITIGSSLPEARGWPEPPFPEATPGTVIAWVDLAKGSSGPVVVQVQEALNAAGATLEADGQFGALTEAAVKEFQTRNGLATTGIVDQTLAGLLGVQNTTFDFPPPGWTWLGWGYNGSAALATWETQMAANTKAIGSVKVGGLRTMPDALPLFEGFLAEIQARGYSIVGGAGAYVFRCTASSRKDCNGLGRNSLSNHAYGLATDINTTQNPMKTYYGTNGNTACQTPMQTDMPQWVVQTAEKWGLYWGGYGWSSGCSSPSQVKTSASRDPMHFEFNGTPEQAQAILRFNLDSDCFQVANSSGLITNKCLQANEVPQAGTRVVVDTDAPAGATAALVNITIVDATTSAYVTAEGCGAMSGSRQWSNGNTRPGRNTAASAIVPIDSEGRFCIYQSGSLHTIVDVQGFYAPASAAPNGNLLTLATPQRTVDTRVTSYCLPDGSCGSPGPVPAGTEIVSTATAPVTVTAAVANITVVSPTSPGYVTADSCAGLTPGTQTRSNVNFAAGDVVANLAVVPAITTAQGAQFCTYSPAKLHEVIDVQGFFNPAAQGGLGFNLQTPSRLVDTRQCWTDPVTGAQRCGSINSARSVIRVKAPAGASAVMVNLTTVDAKSSGYATAGACSTIATTSLATSNVNAVVGAAVANTALVQVDPDGMFCVYLSSSMHAIVDLLGTYSPSGNLRFVPVTPVRVLDTRPQP